jgi:hypothetical protein
LPKSGELFSTSTSIATVPSAVIWGVTASRSEAETNSTWISVAVVETTGIRTPCSISARSLFCVAILGDDRILPRPSV